MEYKLGAIKNPKDLRDIQLAQVQAPVSIPSKYSTDISFIPVLNQKSLGACVGHAHAIVHIYNEYKENGKIPKLSPRYLYALSKKLDGLATEGTYPRVTASIESNKGCATEDMVVNNTDLSHADYINVVETEAITKDARPYRTKGYAEIANDKESLKQAIFQNGIVVVSISVGNFNNPIKKGNIGLHRVAIYGYNRDKFFFRNSWGNWGDNGNGYFNWKDQELSDLLAFVDLPNEIIMDTKNKYKYFADKEIVNLKPELVKALDVARGVSNTPYKINSGFRTVEQNKAAGGTANSAHLRGLAADLASDNVNRGAILRGLLTCGTPLFIEIAMSHIHVDIDSSIHPMGTVIVSSDD